MKWDPHFNVSTNVSSLGDDLLRVLDADVIVGRVREAGKEEPEVVIIGDENLAPGQAFWDSFVARPRREIYSVNTREAIGGLGLTEQDCPASGVAFFQDDLIQFMVGRGLRSSDVIWAGDPDEPKLRIGGILNPRHSFEMFMEKARKESRAWTSSDIHVISALMDRVTEHSHNRMMSILKSGIEQANVKYFDAISRSQENNEFFVSCGGTSVIACFAVPLSYNSTNLHTILIHFFYPEGANKPRVEDAILWCHGLPEYFV
jgi:hypothetical protein